MVCPDVLLDSCLSIWTRTLRLCDSGPHFVTYYY